MPLFLYAATAATEVAIASTTMPRRRMTSEPAQPKLLDRVREAIRVRHYSRRTEEAYAHWIRRYIVFHRKAHPATLGPDAISTFLTWLAVDQRVSASTQNQTLSALLLYREVLGIRVGEIDSVVRARTPERLPAVLSRAEVAAILGRLIGTEWLVVMRLYGVGLRLEECLALRVKDIDLERGQVVVRRGKGQKDRVTTLPKAALDPMGRFPQGVDSRPKGALRAGAYYKLCRFKLRHT